METWNHVAEWGVETIKNIQTRVGLADEDHVRVPHASEEDERHVSFRVEDVDGSAKITPIKAEEDTGDIRSKGTTSSHAAVLKTEREQLTKSGKVVDSSAVKTIHINVRRPSPEPQRSVKGAMQIPSPFSSARQMGSSWLRQEGWRGRRMKSSTEDAVVVKGRSLSPEGWGSVSIQRSLSSESSPPTRAASIPPLASSSQRPLLKKMEVAAERLPPPPRRARFPSPPRSREGKIMYTDAYISSLG